MNSAQKCTVLLTLSAVACGCGGHPEVTKTTTVPPAARPVYMEATPEQLLDRYNGLARSLQSINATVDLKPYTGSAYSGVITEYHDVKAFLLAERPYDIRMIGQVPVIGKTVFDMASNGQNFEVSIPSKNKFLVGPVSLTRTSSKPIENLRPQHLVDALLWPDIRKEEVVLPEEFNDEVARYYVLSVLRGGYQSEFLRKIWFDRSDLHLARLQTYGPKGVLLSDVRYAEWRAADTSDSALKEYPHAIQIDRPHDDYRLELTVAKVVLNEQVAAERFTLTAPEGAEVVNLANVAEDKKP
jgi:outer membrane lipoprotein-sorting protein